MHRSRSTIHVPLLVTLLAIACGGTSDKPPTPPADPTPPDAPVDASAKAPAGPTAEETLAWVLETVKSGGAVSAADIDARFAPSFLKQVPPDKLSAVFKELSTQLGAFKILKQEGKPPLTVTALLETQAGVIRVTVGLTASSPRKMETLLFKPASNEAPPTSYALVVDQLTKAGELSQFHVAEIVKGQCVPAQNHNVTRSMAIGSTFKLYVLLGLTKKLKGATNWDTKLPIRDDLKSLPSGVLQLQKAGTQLTLREYATKMISISDNTATDHLIEFVGRKNVEKALRLGKHGKPASNTPFISTREMFSLKLASTDADRDAFRKGKTAARRKQLAALRGKEINLAMAGDWKTPRDLDIEWFADARDICNVYVALRKAGKSDPSSELLKVLSVNAGVPYSKADWPYLAFKGGAEPGVISLTWLGKRADDRWFVVTATVNDTKKALDDGAVVNAAIGALNILGKERAQAK